MSLKFAKGTIKDKSGNLSDATTITIGKNEQCDISLGNEMLLSDFHTTIYYDKNLNIWFIKDGYKDEESSTGSWIFSTNPIFIISGMTIRMWNKEIKLFYE